MLASRWSGRLPLKSSQPSRPEASEGILQKSTALFLCRQKGQVKFPRWEKLGIFREYQEDTGRMTGAMRAVERAEVGD